MPPSELDNHIAAKFAARRVRFYHAENLRNFATYCTWRAVLSRSELKQKDPVYYTRFYSDASDEDLGALTRVFGNIYDFGSIFARAGNTIPNVYGPITLVFKPTVFAQMTDISITPKSIVNLGAAWTAARVTDPAVVDEIVAGDAYGRPVAPEWQMSELSCENSSLSFDHLEKILVEPIVVVGRALIDYVKATTLGLNVPVAERPYARQENIAKFGHLVDTCEKLPEGIDNEDWSFSVDQLPGSWATLSNEKRKRLPGWCRYFYFGTLTECRLREFIEQMDEADDRTTCDLCDPGDDRSPPLVNYRPVDDGGTGPSQLDVGHCDWCNGISVRCNECGAVRGVPESDYDEVIECDGGCGTRFQAARTYDTDGGDSVIVELIENEDEWEGEDDEGDSGG